MIAYSFFTLFFFSLSFRWSPVKLSFGIEPFQLLYIYKPKAVWNGCVVVIGRQILKFSSTDNRCDIFTPPSIPIPINERRKRYECLNEISEEIRLLQFDTSNWIEYSETHRVSSEEKVSKPFLKCRNKSDSVPLCTEIHLCNMNQGDHSKILFKQVANGASSTFHNISLVFI